MDAEPMITDECDCADCEATREAYGSLDAWRREIGAAVAEARLEPEAG